MTKEKAIHTAAKWWTDKLRQRQPHSNGDNSTSSIFTCMLADIGAKKPTEDQLALFETELERLILEFMDTYDDRWVVLSCDYGPGLLLYDAAQKASINLLNFPFKTHMHIRKNGDDFEVSVSDGYAQPYDTVPPYEEGDHHV